MRIERFFISPSPKDALCQGGRVIYKKLGTNLICYNILANRTF